MNLTEWKREAIALAAHWPHSLLVPESVDAFHDILHPFDVRDVRKAIADLAADTKRGSYCPLAAEIKGVASGVRDRRLASEASDDRALPAPADAPRGEIADLAAAMAKRLSAKRAAMPEPELAPVIELHPRKAGVGIAGDVREFSLIIPPGFQPKWRWYDDRRAKVGHPDSQVIHARWFHNPIDRNGVDPAPCGAPTAAAPLSDREAAASAKWRCVDCAAVVEGVTVAERVPEEVSA